MTEETIHLKIRSLIADKEMVSAIANHECNHGDGWLSNHREHNEVINKEIDSLFAQLKEEGEVFTASKPKPPKGLPSGWARWPASKQASTRVSENNPKWERIGSWFGRKATTLPTVQEAGLFQNLNPPEDELELMGSFYEAMISEEDYRRTSLVTLLNNWNGELDKARAWAQKNK